MSKPSVGAVLIQLNEHISQVPWLIGWGQETGRGSPGTQSSSSDVHSASWAANWLIPTDPSYQRLTAKLLGNGEVTCFSDSTDRKSSSV